MISPKEQLEKFVEKFRDDLYSKDAHQDQGGDYSQYENVKNFLIHSHIQLLKSLKDKAEGEIIVGVATKEIKKGEVEFVDISNRPEHIAHNNATQNHIDTITKLISEYEELLPTSK